MVHVIAPDAVPLLPENKKPHIAVSLVLGQVIRIDNVYPQSSTAESEERFKAYIHDLEQEGVRTLEPTFYRGKSLGGYDMRYTALEHVRCMIDFEDVTTARDQAALAKYDALLAKMTHFAQKRIVEGGDNFTDLLSLRQCILDAEVEPDEREPILVDIDMLDGRNLLPATNRDERKVRNHVVDQVIDFMHDYFELHDAMDTVPESRNAIEGFINDFARDYPRSITPEISNRLLTALNTCAYDLLDIQDDPDGWWLSHDVIPYY